MRSDRYVWSDRGPAAVRVLPSPSVVRSINRAEQSRALTGTLRLVRC